MRILTCAACGKKSTYRGDVTIQRADFPLRGRLRQYIFGVEKNQFRTFVCPNKHSTLLPFEDKMKTGVPA